MGEGEGGKGGKGEGGEVNKGRRVEKVRSKGRPKVTRTHKKHY
jgi:hypothetical protein